MKTDGKPVSFIEDAAVPLEHLADYTERLTDVFTKHGTTGTWYAHASVGCLHVRPVLNLKLEKDAATMRAIAEGSGNENLQKLFTQVESPWIEDLENGLQRFSLPGGVAGHWCGEGVRSRVVA